MPPPAPTTVDGSVDSNNAVPASLAARYPWLRGAVSMWVTRALAYIRGEPPKLRPFHESHFRGCCKSLKPEGITLALYQTLVLEALKRCPQLEYGTDAKGKPGFFERKASPSKPIAVTAANSTSTAPSAAPSRPSSTVAAVASGVGAYPWLQSHVDFWVDKALAGIRGQRGKVPYHVSDFLGVSKSAPLPAGVDRETYQALVFAAMQRSPKLVFGKDAKDRPCFTERKGAAAEPAVARASSGIPALIPASLAGAGKRAGDPTAAGKPAGVPDGVAAAGLGATSAGAADVAWRPSYADQVGDGLGEDAGYAYVSHDEEEDGDGDGDGAGDYSYHAADGFRSRRGAGAGDDDTPRAEAGVAAGGGTGSALLEGYGRAAANSCNVSEAGEAPGNDSRAGSEEEAEDGERDKEDDEEEETEALAHALAETTLEDGEPEGRRSAASYRAGLAAAAASAAATRGSHPAPPGTLAGTGHPPLHGRESAPAPRSREAALEGFFSGGRSRGAAGLRTPAGIVLADAAGAGAFSEGALLGHHDASVAAAGADGRSDAAGDAAVAADDAPPQPVYLNTHEPFCFAAVGVQGGGKSHTLACVLEACLVPFPEEGVVRLDRPMSALVLHYEQNVSSVCEATGLISPLPALRFILGAEAAAARCLPRDKLVVLVSPSYYRQRLAFYGTYCTVRPLLFRWADLSADHIKRIMRIREGDNQLYVATMMDLLRRYQRAGAVPTFARFMAQVTEVCKVEGQRGPLQQRLAMLESVVAESDINSSIAREGADLASVCGPGTLVVVDLTDPLLASEEANGIFQVLTEQYRALPMPSGCGKLLALDEAHKFMSGDAGAGDGLSDAIVDVARLMRHDGMRLAVSTQSPKALAPELLELVTLAVLHRFHSRDWFSYLEKKIPLSDEHWGQLMALQPGQALAFASQHRVHRPVVARVAESGGEGGASGDAYSHGHGSELIASHVLPLTIRPRFTADRGATRRNASAESAAPSSSVQRPLPTAAGAGAAARVL